MQNNYSNQELTYAGFWVRLAAYCLDSILVFLVLLVVRLFLSGIMSLLSGTPLGGNLIFQYDLKDIVLYVFLCMRCFQLIFCFCQLCLKRCPAAPGLPALLLGRKP